MLGKCAKFSKMELKEKLQFVNSMRLFSLKSGHWIRDCSSKFSCRECRKKHNSLILPGFPLSSNGAGSSDHPVSKPEKTRNEKSIMDKVATCN